MCERFDCRIPSEPGKTYCILHLPGEKDVLRFKEALYRQIDEEGLEHTRNSRFSFERYHFPVGIVCSESANRSGREVVMPASINGDVDFNRAVIAGNANFRDTTIKGDANFHSAKIAGDAKFICAAIEGNAVFVFTQIAGYAVFEGTTIGGYVDFNYAVIGGNAEFRHAQTTSYANFDRAQIEGHANFDFAQIEGHVIFTEAKITAHANFRNARIAKAADFQRAWIGGDADFRNAKIGRYARFISTTIARDALFKYAEIGHNAEFSHAKIKGSVNFENSNIELGAEFKQSEIDGNINFENSRIRGDANFRYTTIAGDAFFDACSSSYICVGNAQPRFQGWKLGPDRCGIQFCTDSDASSFWRFAHLTYAKNGDRKKADAAYYFERVWHWKELRSIEASRGHRLRPFRTMLLRTFYTILWLLDLLLVRWTTSYGASIARLFATWFVVIGGFGITFSLMPELITAPVREVPLWNWIVGFLYSATTFTTLGLGNIEPSPLSRLSMFLTSIEALLGAILIALAVLVIGRKFMR